MLITFSSRILARFQTGPPEILAAGKILTARNFDSRRKSRQHSHRDIRLPAKNPGKTPAGILPRFWPPGSRFPPRIPARFPPGSCRDFGRRESRLPPRIPARFPPGIPSPAKNPGKIPAGNPASRQESRQDSRRDPAEILAAGNPAFPPRIPVRIPAGTGNPGGQNLGGIPAGILAGSWQDPGTIFTRVGFESSSFPAHVSCQRCLQLLKLMILH